ncbi:hypothetical protein M422DRAFT_97623, partial [Sphaerobolus stellatus SS14]
SGKHFSDQDLTTFRAFAFESETKLGVNTFEKLRNHFPELEIDSLKALRSKIKDLSGLRPVKYDCCINSCMAYTGDHAEKTSCDYCEEPRHDENGFVRNVFEYIPLGPRLKHLYASPRSAKRNSYRANYKPDINKIADFFDGKLYKKLKKKFVEVLGKVLPRKYFDDPRDIALLLVTDGFQIFRKAKHTC